MDQSVEINGGHVVYEIIGAQGDFIALTPVGRFSKEVAGLRPLAQALCGVAAGGRWCCWTGPATPRGVLLAARERVAA